MRTAKDEFRYNRVTKHPAYIYEQNNDKYKNIGITHSRTTHGVKNIKLDKNPNPKDSSFSYFRPKSMTHKTNKFANRYNNWSLSDSDKKQIEKYKE